MFSCGLCGMHLQCTRELDATGCKKEGANQITLEFGSNMSVNEVLEE